MGTGYFVDKEHAPSTEELNAALGPAVRLWEEILQFIADNYQIPAEFNFGGRKYGWNLWYRKAGKSLVVLYPQQGYFIAQVVLGREQVEKAMSLNLGEIVGGLLRETPQLHDGKWLFIQVKDIGEVKDIQQLLLIKRKSIKKN
jgi:hypothetical protein